MRMHFIYLFQYDSVVLLGPIGEEKPDSEPSHFLECLKCALLGMKGPGTDTSGCSKDASTPPAHKEVTGLSKYPGRDHILACHFDPPSF